MIWVEHLFIRHDYDLVKGTIVSYAWQKMAIGCLERTDPAREPSPNLPKVVYKYYFCLKTHSSEDGGQHSTLSRPQE